MTPEDESGRRGEGVDHSMNPAGGTNSPTTVEQSSPAPPTRQRRARRWHSLARRRERTREWAYCMDCEWEERGWQDGRGARRAGYDHAGRRGHRVYVRIENEYQLSPKQRIRSVT